MKKVLKTLEELKADCLMTAYDCVPKIFSKEYLEAECSSWFCVEYDIDFIIQDLLDKGCIIRTSKNKFKKIRMFLTENNEPKWINPLDFLYKKIN